MESFSLLKYWRGGGGGGGNASGNPRSASASGGTTNIVTAVTTTPQAVDTEDDDDEDDGPFFDLEFSVSDEEETEENEESDDQNGGVSAKFDGNGDEGQFNFTLSSGSSGEPSDPSLTLSPSDDLFFKGKLVPIETESSLESKATQLPVSLIKSATKFRVFLLKLKNSKLNSPEKTESGAANEPVSDQKQENNKNKRFTAKFKVEEVPIMSLFSRDNSKLVKQVQQCSEEDSVSDEKKFTEDVMQKYLNKVKPLYVKVSRKYGDKLKFSGQLNLGSLKPSTQPSTAVEKGQVEVGKNMKQMNIQAGLRVVCKHLGKSRSASSAAVAAAPLAAAGSKRRDDSLLQQEDGIRGAILHCKRSFNGSQDSSEATALPRSVSDPSHEKSINLSRKSSPDEDKT